MARAHFRDSVQGSRADGALVPLGGASVAVRQTGTTTPIALPIYDAGGAVLGNPLTADARGVIDFYLDSDERVDLYATSPGYDPVTATVDVISQATLTAPTIEGGLFNNGNLANPSVAGDITFATGGGQRIVGDFFNLARASRVLFQSSGTNHETTLGAIPTGTSNAANFVAYAAADPDDAGYVQLGATTTQASVQTGASGVASAPALSLYVAGGAQAVLFPSGGLSMLSGADPGAGIVRVAGQLRVTGNVGFYGSAGAAKPTVTGAKGGNAAVASLLAALVALGLVTDSTTA